jgi:hypothetical protein
MKNMKFIKNISNQDNFDHLNYSTEYLKSLIPASKSNYDQVNCLKNNKLANYRVHFGVAGAYKAFGDQAIIDARNTINYPFASAWQLLCGAGEILGGAAIALTSPIQLASKNKKENIKKQAQAGLRVGLEGVKDTIVGLGGCVLSLVLIPAMILKTLVNFISASFLTAKDFIWTPTTDGLNIQKTKNFAKSLHKNQSCTVESLSDSKYIISKNKKSKEFLDLLPDSNVSKIVNFCYKPFGYARRGVEQFGNAILDSGEATAHLIKGSVNYLASPIAAINGKNTYKNCKSDAISEVWNNNLLDKFAQRINNVVEGNRLSYLKK